MLCQGVLDEISKCCGETETPKYMKAFILQEITESRRLIRVLRDEVDIAKITLGQQKDLGLKDYGFESEDSRHQGEIRTFKGHLNIMDASINSE
nr:hypothetical protein [Tanacetum cinerariifolium]